MSFSMAIYPSVHALLPLRFVLQCFECTHVSHLVKFAPHKDSRCSGDGTLVNPSHIQLDRYRSNWNPTKKNNAMQIIIRVYSEVGR